MRFAAVAISISLVFLIGCDKDQDGAKNARLAGARSQLNDRVKQRREKAGGVAPRPSEASRKDSVLDPVASAPKGFVYTAIDRDPFRSFEWEGLELAQDTLRGPLEQFDVSQLAVVAVVWATGTAKALIQDPSGQSYIVGMGTRMGKNEGSVVKIDDNLVVVKETYVDFLGHETKKDIEMRIRRSEEG